MSALQDYFVGFFAVAFGCCLIFGAALNASWLMSLKHPRLLTDSVGTTVARWLLGCLGLVVIAIGSLVAAGWRIDWSNHHHDAASPAPASRGS